MKPGDEMGVMFPLKSSSSLLWPGKIFRRGWQHVAVCLHIVRFIRVEGVIQPFFFFKAEQKNKLKFNFFFFFFAQKQIENSGKKKR